jgi:ribosomal protein S18 acetylase RimI-like enzyme
MALLGRVAEFGRLKPPPVGPVAFPSALIPLNLKPGNRRSAMQIRPYQPADSDAVTALWRACDLVRPWNDPHKDIRRKMQVRPEWFLVGVIDNRVVASVMAGYEGHRGWLNYLAVDPALRRRGLARQMVEAAERLLQEAGCPKVNLQVRTSNRGAVEFYRRIGYRIDDVISLGKRLEVDETSLPR